MKYPLTYLLFVCMYPVLCIALYIYIHTLDLIAPVCFNFEGSTLNYILSYISTVCVANFPSEFTALHTFSAK